MLQEKKPPRPPDFNVAWTPPRSFPAGQYFGETDPALTSLATLKSGAGGRRGVDLNEDTPQLSETTTHGASLNFVLLPTGGSPSFANYESLCAGGQLGPGARSKSKRSQKIKNAAATRGVPQPFWLCSVIGRLVAPSFPNTTQHFPRCFPLLLFLATKAPTNAVA